MPILKRFQSNIVFSRRVVTEISNLVPGSNVQQSGRSSVAPFTSKGPIRKRVASADRRAMLESFVNKYRAMNMGKFPTPTSAQKEVGGGYYSIKKMLQEMEYNFKISSSLEKGIVKENETQTKGEDTISMEIAVEPSGSQEESTSQIPTVNKSTWIVKENETQTKGEDTTISMEIAIKPSGSQEESTSQITTVNNKSTWIVKENETQTKGEDTIIMEIAVEPSGSQEVSTSQITTDQQLYEDALPESVGNLDSNFELKEGLQLSTSSANTGNSTTTTRDDTHNIATESHDIRGQRHENQESNAKDDSPLEDFGLKSSEPKVDHQHDDMLTRDIKRQKDEELREKPSIWGNLKSMATNFISIWKK